MTSRLRHSVLPALAAVVAFACTTDTLIGPREVASLAVAPPSLTLPVGDTILIQAVATDAQGVRYIGEDVTWSVADSTIVTISAIGRVVTRAVGSTIVTARAGGRTATGSITVTPQPTIHLSADTITFTAIAKGPLPSGQTVAISNTGGGTLTGVALGATAYTGPDTGWLAATLSSAVAPDTVALTVLTDSFPLATYTATIPVSAPKTTNSPHALVVRLVLSAGTPTQALKSAGDAQTAPVHTAPATRPAVQVKDQYGNPVESTTVTFAVTAGNGQITGATVKTDAAGIATVGSWTLDTVAKVDTLTATVAALPTAIFTATATPGPAAVIARRGPSGQVDTIGASLPIPDSVRVTDVYGNAVAGVSIVWASGSGGSLTPAGAVTNAAGLVTASRMLGTVPGATTDTAKATGLTGSPILFGVTTNPGNAVSIVKQGGDSATDTVAATLPVPYTVRVSDRIGNPVPGVTVTWAVSGGGSVPATSLTSGAGVASATRILGTVAGPQGASATVAGLAGSPVLFSAVALHGAAKILAKNGGDAQNTTVDSLVTPQPSVIVTDQFGNPVSGIGVTFALGAGGARNGAITGTSPTTNASGVATLGSWRLGSVAGPDTVTATSAGLTGSPLRFIDFGNSGSAAIMSLAGGDAQTDTVGATLSTYSVLVTDGASNPVSGVTVSWTAFGGGSITPSSITNASGIAVATRVFGTTAGPQNAQASVGGLAGSPVAFSATALHATPTTLAKTAGDGLSATVNAATATAPAVAVTDQFGNPVSGVSVTFTVPATHGSVSGGSTTTAANGVAQAASWVLDSIAGANSLTATAGIALSGNPAGFTATGTPAAVSANTSTVSATTSTITACAASCSPGTTATTITVTARDQFGNVISGAAVRDSGNPATGNNATAAGATNGSGAFASTFFSTKAEAKTVAARINGVAVAQTAAVTVAPTVVDLALSTITASLPSITACSTSCSTFSSTASTITVTVVDTFSNPIPGAAISYFLTGSTNTITPSSGSSDVNGVFTSAFSSTTAESKLIYGYDSPFGYVANTTPVSVTVNPGAASSIAISSGNGQSARVGTGVGTKPTAVVRDAFSNPVPGVLVTFAGLTGGGSAGGTSVSTNASGLATLGSWTLGGTAADDGLGRMANTIGASASGTGTATFTDYGIFTWSGDASPLISTGSVCAGCHAWTYAGIVNVTSSCGTLKYVVASSAGTSYMYNKISTATPSCGSEMPLGGPFYSAAQLKIVRAWINNGALNN